MWWCTRYKKSHRISNHSGIGVTPPTQPVVTNHGQKTKGISLLDFPPTDIAGRRIAVLAADGASARQIDKIKECFERERVVVEVISPVSFKQIRRLFASSSRTNLKDFSGFSRPSDL